MRLTVRVTPRGGRDAVEGWTADAEGRALLKVRVAAAPSDGAANEAVLAVVARALGLAKSRVRLAGGASARVKTLEIEGLEAGDLTRAFGPPPAASDR
jgi:hypothetical protein